MKFLENIFDANFLQNSFLAENGLRNEYCYFEFDYTGTEIIITGNTSSFTNGLNNVHSISIYINDVFYALFHCEALGNHRARFILPTGQKNIKIYNSAQTANFAIDSVTTPAYECHLTGVFAEKGRHSVVQSKQVANKIVWLADSIGSGTSMWNGANETFSRKFIEEGYDLAYIGGGGEALLSLASTVNQRNLTRSYINSFLSNVTGRKIVVFQVGTNDYGSALPKATFKSYADSVIQTLISDHPTIEIYLMTMFPRASETSLLQDLRNTYIELAVTYSNNCTVIPAKDFLPFNTTNFFDGVHLTGKEQHSQVYNLMKPYIIS